MRTASSGPSQAATSAPLMTTAIARLARAFVHVLGRREAVLHDDRVVGAEQEGGGAEQPEAARS